MFELLPREAERGLARLPEPSSRDVFFDIEGDSFAADGGREYLFGYASRGDGGEVEYREPVGVQRRRGAARCSRTSWPR